MVDLATTRAQAKGAAPFASGEGGYTEADTTTPLKALLPPSDGLDKLYHQLAEIHTIGAA
jgi:hypothetical protein